MSNQLSQVPINNTYQVHVPPGNQTGLYYILLANLPWQTSWQQVKDHVRTVCSVKRVEIFNESTSGWVMVEGRENFEHACGALLKSDIVSPPVKGPRLTRHAELLSGRLFNGRPIFIDDRNATEPTPIRILAHSKLPEGASQTPLAPASSFPPAQTGRVYGPEKASHTPSAPASSFLPAQMVTVYGHRWTAQQPYPVITHLAVSHGASAVTTTTQYGYSESQYYSYREQALPAPAVPVGSSFEGAAYYYPQTYPPGSSAYEGAAPRSSAPATEVRDNRSTPSGFVKTEQRDIIIRCLPSWAENSHVDHLVRSIAGVNPTDIRVPCSDGGSNRGFAFVELESHTAAVNVIKKLHCRQYEGKQLRVNLTKDSVSEAESSRRKMVTRPHTSRNHGGGGSGAKPRREDWDTKGKAPSWSSAWDTKGKVKDKAPPSPPSFLSSKPSVVIVNGSTNRR